MFCSKCGSQLKDDVLYCPNCGDKVNKLVDVEKQSSQKNFDKDLYIEVLNISKQFANSSAETRIKKIRDKYPLTAIEAIKILAEYDNNPNEFIQKYIENDDVSKQSFKENQSIVVENKNKDEADPYIVQYRAYIEKEHTINKYEEYVNGVLGLLFIGLYISYGFNIIISIIAAGIMIVILNSVIIGPIVRKIKKNHNCLNSEKRYDKYVNLSSTMDSNAAYNMVELEFKQLSSKKGLIYYLLCILLIIIIFSML